MAPQHLLRTFEIPPRRSPGDSRPISAALGHLRVMTTQTLRDASETTTTSSLADGILSLSELCAQLHVKTQTIYDLRSQGRGPRGFRVGRELRFRASEIDAWLARLESEDDQRHDGPRH